MLALLFPGLLMGGSGVEAPVATPNICLTLSDVTRLDVTLLEVEC